MGHISIVVPVYQVEQYLYRCIDSILAQTYDDFELILVDDGSPDLCGAMCEYRSKQDSRIVVIHQENGGLSAARNAGIDWAFEHSNSQWLFFVDSDDFIHPETLQRLLTAANVHGTDISIGGFFRTSGKSLEVEEKDLDSVVWIPKDLFIQHNVEAVVAWGKLYRKSLFEGIRYPLGKLHEDEFTTHKLLFQCSSVSVISAPLYGYFTNENSIMGSRWSPRRMDAIDAFKERITFFEEMGNPELRNHTIRCLASNAAAQFAQAKDFPTQRKQLRKELRSTLLRHRRCFSFMKDDWLYDTAFPRISCRLRRLFSK